MANASTPSLSSTRPPSPSGTFFPHILIDHILPTLKGSEWPLLTVIIRQTMGWQDKTTGARKTQDWLTHGQLKARTARGSEAVCAAIDGLVRKGLIEVRDKRGHLLPTPAARRRCRDRLYYSLSPTLQAHFSPATSFTPEKNKPTWPPSIPVSRFGKAETTKEIDTKLYPFGKTETEQPTLLNEGDCGMSAEEIEMATLHFIERYKAMFLDFLPGEAPLVTKDAEEQLHGLLRRYSEVELERMLEPFFHSRFVYIQQRGYTVASFVTSFHLLRAVTRDRKKRIAEIPN